MKVKSVLKKPLAFAILIGSVYAFAILRPNIAEAKKVIGAGDGDGMECKVEIFDCPGWGTGDRQICHQNGDGVSCSNCGESTTCE